MGGKGSGPQIISHFNYPRKRKHKPSTYIRLLDRIRTETPIHIPFGARISRIYTPAPPDYFKWMLYTADGELTRPRLGSPIPGTRLMKYKRLVAMQSKDGHTIEITGAGRRKKARPRGEVEHWGEITGPLGKNHEVVGSSKGGGLTAELRGKEIGIRTKVMWDDVGKEDVLVVEWLRDGRVVRTEVYREEDIENV